MKFYVLLINKKNRSERMYKFTCISRSARHHLACSFLSGAPTTSGKQGQKPTKFPVFHYTIYIPKMKVNTQQFALLLLGLFRASSGPKARDFWPAEYGPQRAN